MISVLAWGLVDFKGKCPSNRLGFQICLFFVIHEKNIFESIGTNAFFKRLIINDAF